jgi:hypothetical protein
MHGNHRSRVVANHMPFLNVILDANLIDLLRKAPQKIRAVRLARRLSHPWQINRKALVASAQSLDHTLPKATAGGHPVNEQDRNPGAAAYNVHEGTPIKLMM